MAICALISATAPSLFENKIYRSAISCLAYLGDEQADPRVGEIGDPCKHQAPKPKEASAHGLTALKKTTNKEVVLLFFLTEIF